jgi:hypothetical protein
METNTSAQVQAEIAETSEDTIASAATDGAGDVEPTDGAEPQAGADGTEPAGDE